MRKFLLALALLTGGCSATGLETSDAGYFARTAGRANDGTALAARTAEDARMTRVSQSVLAASVELCRNVLPAGPAPERACAVPIVVAPSGTIAASTNGERVRITKGFIDLTASDDELAFVVAHELAHVLLRHQVSLGDAGRRNQELEADTLGLYISMRAGYDGRAALGILPRLAGYLRTDAGDGRYPGFSERQHRLLAQVERMKGLAAASAKVRRQLAAAEIVAEVVSEIAR